MASAGGVVQSDVFHLEFNRITTPATEPFNRLEQKMALVDLHAKHGLESCLFKAEIQAAGTRK